MSHTKNRRRNLLPVMRNTSQATMKGRIQKNTKWFMLAFAFFFLPPTLAQPSTPLVTRRTRDRNPTDGEP